MYIVDANVLIYAFDADAAHHDRARGWLESQATQRIPVGFAWGVIVAFLRLTTSPRFWKSPWSTAQAVTAVAELLAFRTHFVAETTERHWTLLADLMERGQAAGNLVPDAHLAAVALEHGATLVTFDRDFSRFSGLRLLNLLDVE